MKRTYDAKFFCQRCPYTGKLCYKWECSTCEVDVREKEFMKAIDDADKESFESDRQEREQ